MATLNPMQLAAMLKQGNPQQVARQIIQTNYPNDPQMQQLLSMAERGDTQGLQKAAQNIFSSQGKDFATEMQNFMQAMRSL